MNFGLKVKDIDNIKKVFANYNDVNKVIIYGSRAMGNYRNNSDIDLVMFGNNLNLSVLSKIETDLDDLLLPYKIDLSIFAYIDNKDLIDHIKQNGIVFYQLK